MATIEELLHRRNDLSTFLVHLTRNSSTATARDNLLSIAKNLRIEARRPLGPAAKLDPYLGTVTQRVVCFTETPLEHTWMMIQDIDGRDIQFSPYGIVITKTTAREAHCNPVWYTDISTRGGRDWPIKAVNELVSMAQAASTTAGVIDPVALQSHSIFRITPFIEQMGPTTNTHKEFWWEREWRHVDDYPISPRRIVAFLVPEHDHQQFAIDLFQDIWATKVRPLLDPMWGTERMIAALSGIDIEEIGPFPGA